MHGIRPYFKSKIEEVHSHYQLEILNSISRFRDKKNLTVYLYDFYLKKLELTTEKTYIFSYFSSASPASAVCTAIINPHVYKTICINDTFEEEDKQRIQIINEYFNSQLPNQSKYEKLV